MKFKSTLKTNANFLDLTPLVDVIFLLLIFFMLTSQILPMRSLHIENPTVDRQMPSISSQILVTMDADHAIYFGQEQEIVDLETLKMKLKETIEVYQLSFPQYTPIVMLSLDKHVEYEAFLRLFSTAQECCPRVRLIYKPMGMEIL